MSIATDVADFEPAARVVQRVVAGVRDDRLADPTPCAKWSVGDLLDHLVGLTMAFRLAAAKQPQPTPPDP